MENPTRPDASRRSFLTGVAGAGADRASGVRRQDGVRGGAHRLVTQPQGGLGGAAPVEHRHPVGRDDGERVSSGVAASRRRAMRRDSPRTLKASAVSRMAKPGGYICSGAISM